MNFRNLRVVSHMADLDVCRPDFPLAEAGGNSAGSSQRWRREKQAPGSLGVGTQACKINIIVQPAAFLSSR